MARRQRTKDCLLGHTERPQATRERSKFRTERRNNVTRAASWRAASFNAESRSRRSPGSENPRSDCSQSLGFQSTTGFICPGFADFRCTSLREQADMIDVGGGGVAHSDVTAANHRDDDDGADLSGLDAPLEAAAAATRFGRARFVDRRQTRAGRRWKGRPYVGLLSALGELKAFCLIEVKRLRSPLRSTGIQIAHDSWPSRRERGSFEAHPGASSYPQEFLRIQQCRRAARPLQDTGARRHQHHRGRSGHPPVRAVRLCRICRRRRSLTVEIARVTCQRETLKFWLGRLVGCSSPSR